MTPDRGWQPRVREPSAGAARPICEDRSSAGAVTTTRNPTNARSPVRTDPDRRRPLRAPAGRTGRAAVWRATAAGFALVLAVLLGDGVVRPAAAEAPAGDMESIVTSIEPATPDVEVRVLGGDETLRLDVHDGHEVVVLGYVGEPYLRIDRQGEVWENQRSPAVTANADRSNTGTPPSTADPAAEPEWVHVGSGAAYEWHDHRMHWMTEAVEPPGGPGDLVFAWTVGLTVDGAPVAVQGELRRGESTPAWPWYLLAAVVAVLALVLGLTRRRTAASITIGSAVAVTAIAAALAVGERRALECWTCGRLIELAPILVATRAPRATAVVRTTGARLVAAALALVALSGWLLVHLRVLARPIVVSAWADPVVRGAVAVALGLTVAGLVLAAIEGRRVLDEYASLPPSQRRPRGRRGAVRPG